MLHLVGEWELKRHAGLETRVRGKGVYCFNRKLELADWGPGRQVEVVTAQVLAQGICFLIRRWQSYVVSSISSDGAQLPWLLSHETISPNKPFSPGVPLGLRVQWQESPLRSSVTHATALEHWYPALHFHSGPKAPWSLQVFITKEEAESGRRETTGNAHYGKYGVWGLSRCCSFLTGIWDKLTVRLKPLPLQRDGWKNHITDRLTCISTYDHSKCEFIFFI